MNMTDAALVARTDEASKRLQIFASALGSLEKTGAGGRVRRLLATIAAEFESFARAVARARARKRGPLYASSRAKRLSQKG